ncbi:RDD family protein [Jannaschia aquimarina]|uniref:RDD family protein n=1 Tax=Jannaschia aquimarina TaxID=935700 RepID=A0A0D1EJ32_9RHOB|nr:RDD family protein [Jannaschia aquimarina]KIT16966.1 RDD family protein [Jannaschia aquimarina]SNT33302.1 RDD family protein [Jannaschia aquimarina]
MTALTHETALPCPHRQPEFYRGVVVKRGLAWVVDATLITLFTFVAGILTLSVAWFLWPLFFLAIGAAYRIATLASGSATWGMRLLGIELRNDEGARLDGTQAILHVTGYYASVMFAILPALASVVAMLVTERKQGLTDLVLGTAAINRPG